MGLRDFFGRRLCVPVCLVVRPVAIAVFEVDAKVFNRLSAQFLHDTCSNRSGEFCGLEAQHSREGRSVWRVLLEHPKRDRAELSGGIRSEQMRATVNGVDRLPIA